MVKVFRYGPDSLGFSGNVHVLYHAGKDAVIVDLGMADPAILEFLKNHGLTLKAILITHGHFDHIAGIDWLESRLPHPVPVFVNHKDARWLTDAGLNAPGDPSDGVKVETKPTLIDREGLLPIEGFEIHALFTPFHTPGSTCYWLPKDQIVFTGDTLFKGTIGRTDLIGGDDASIWPSLSKLKRLPDDTVVYPGHDSKTTIGKEKESNPFFH